MGIGLRAPSVESNATKHGSISSGYGRGVGRNVDEYSRPRLLESAPAALSDFVRETVASRFLHEQPATDGFTPSVASIVIADDDRQFFVKAGPKADAGGEGVRAGAELADVVTDLGPALISWAERDGWYVAVYECLAGTVVDEWRIADIEELAALSITMREQFDPCPLGNTVPFADVFAPLLGAWSALIDADGPAEESIEHVRGRELPYGLRIETLAELETDWFAALRGGTSLQHGDIRRDNVIREPSGRLRLVDWTHRWTAPYWADWVRLVPDIAASGLDPEQMLLRIAGPETPKHEVNVMLAGLAGRCWRDSHLPAVTGLPQLRPLQSLQADMTLRWLAQRGVR